MAPIGSVRACVLGGGVDIPNTRLEHFYYSPALSGVDTWFDVEGGKDLSASGDPTLATGINNNRSVSYDGTNKHENGTAEGLGTDGVYTAVIVLNLDNTDNNYSLLTNGTADTNGYDIAAANGNYQVGHGNSAVSGGTLDTNPHVVVVTYDGTNLIIDVDGSEVNNSTLSSPSTPSGSFKTAEGGSNNLQGDLGAVGHDPVFSDATRRDDLTQKLGDAFDITVSV